MARKTPSASPEATPSLPTALRVWLAVVGALVPGELRNEWRREWSAELRCSERSAFGRWVAATGALGDALWHLLDDWSLDTLRSELHQASRALRRRVGVSLLAVSVLGLGLGSAVVVVSVVDAVLLRPLPFPEPDRLIQVWEQNPTKGWDRNVVAPANLLDWRENAESLEDLAAYGSWTSRLILEVEGSDARPLDTLNVGPRFFDVLRTPMHLGRDFEDDERWRSAEPVAILSWGLWTRSFGSDPGVLGETVTIEGADWTVVGVAPEGFSFPERVDVFLPFRWADEAPTQAWFRRAHFLRAVGRLAPGATVDDARAELAAIASRLEGEYPETNTDMGTGVTPLHEWVVGDTRHPLGLVAAAVGLLLVVACANVASLLLLRAGSRHRELAVRTALGAARRRIARLLAIEGLLLAAAASILGILFARGALEALTTLAVEVPRLDQATLDPRTLLAALGLALIATLGFTLAPVVAASRIDLRSALRPGAGRHSAGRRHVGLRRALVVAEVALATLLVVGAGLFLRSLVSLRNVDPGFEPEGVLSVRINLPGANYPDAEQVQAAYDRLSERFAALPSVSSVAQSRTLPIGGSTWTSDYSLRASEAYGVETQHLEVDEGYAETLGLHLVAGRWFTPADRDDAPRVAIVSRELVRSLLPNADPASVLGREICGSRTCTEEDTAATIIGVVEDLRFEGLARPANPILYHSLRQRGQWDREIFLKTDFSIAGVATLERQLAAIVRDLDPGLPLMEFRTLDEVVADSLVRERFLTALLSAFGVLALGLAIVGTYGVLATSVRLRRRELGIRAALGARASQLEAAVLRDGLGLVLLGVVLGLGSARVGGHWIESQLFGITAKDLTTFASALVLLLVTGALAAWRPARAAARIDPTIVLREE